MTYAMSQVKIYNFYLNKNGHISLIPPVVGHHHEYFLQISLENSKNWLNYGGLKSKIDGLTSKTAQSVQIKSRQSFFNSIQADVSI